MIGETIAGRYSIVRLLGEGGMGAVYEARHTGTGRRIALKVITGELARNPQSVERFQLEAKAAGALESEHIVQVLDVGHDEARNAPFLAMEFLVGEDVQHVIERLGPLPPDLALRVGVQACMGLEKAHAQGVVHRDIKPANLFLIEREGGLRSVKVLDFGIAKVTAEDGAPVKKSLTRTGSLLGSPLYMSPEQARGKSDIDQRTDIWSLGVVLYEALTGQTPLHDLQTLGDFIIAVCSEPVPPLRARAPWVSPAIAAAVERALVIDPRQRYQNAREMGAALAALLPPDGGAIYGAMLVPAKKDGSAAYTPAPVTTAMSPPFGAPMAGTPSLAGATVVADGPYFHQMPTASMTPTPSHPVIGLPPSMTPSPGPVMGLPPSMQPTPSPGYPVMGLPPHPSMVAAPPARKAKSSIGIFVGVGLALAVVAGGVGAAVMLKSKGEKPADSVSVPLSASAPEPRASAAPTPLESLSGAWKNEAGQLYDAVPSGEGVEFRIRQSDQFSGQGYAAGEARFIVRAGADPGAFRVEDRIRPAPPKGTSYDTTHARMTCLEVRTAVGDKPLRAELAGERLIVKLASLDTTPAMFTRQGLRVVGCTGLAAAKATEVESLLTRTTAAAAPAAPVVIRPQPGPAPSASHKPVEPQPSATQKPIEPQPTATQPPVEPTATQKPVEPQPTSTGKPVDPGPGPPGGRPCSSDGECFTNNCTGGKCRGNKIGSLCSQDKHCSTRNCAGGKCGPRK